MEGDQRLTLEDILVDLASSDKLQELLDELGTFEQICLLSL